MRYKTMNSEDVIKIIIDVLSLGCGETYCESLSLFNKNTKVCGKGNFICYRCNNKINMVKERLAVCLKRKDVLGRTSE